MNDSQNKEIDELTAELMVTTSQCVFGSREEIDFRIASYVIQQGYRKHSPEPKQESSGLPSISDIERVISFQDLWITHPQRPQGQKRSLAQAIHSLLENGNGK